MQMRACQEGEGLGLPWGHSISQDRVQNHTLEAEAFTLAEVVSPPQLQRPKNYCRLTLCYTSLFISWQVIIYERLHTIVGKEN